MVVRFPFKEELGLSPRAREILSMLPPLVLFTISDLAALTRLSHRVVRAAIEELERNELIGCDQLAWTLKRGERRWFLPDRALQAFEDLGRTWHEEGNLVELLARLPQPEWFYQVAGSVEGLGRLELFQWLAGVSLDAAVRYESGWVALLWSGFMASETQIVKRLEKLGEHLPDLAATADAPWPALFFCVVTDRWQGELFLRAARHFPKISDRLSIFCLSDGSRSGVMAPLDSRGWVYQRVRRRGTGGWPWKKRIETSPWAEPGMPPWTRSSRPSPSGRG